MTTHPVDASWQAARAKENLRAGEELLAAGHFNAAASRLYYALYHAAWFILAKAHRDPRSELPSRREDAAPNQSWPHKHLKDSTNLVVQCIRKPLAQQIFGRRLHENYKKFYTHRIDADYQACGVTRPTLQNDSTELRALVDELLAA